MLLSDREIRIAVQSGDLLIDPLPPEDSERWQAASVDLRLDSTIWVQTDNTENNKTIANVEDLDIARYLSEYMEEVNVARTGGFTLLPGGFIIGRTLETVGLSNFLSGRVEGRSRLARLGIGIHVTAPKIDPGFKNQITLEIFHVGKTKVLIPDHITIMYSTRRKIGIPGRTRLPRHFPGAKRRTPI